MKDLFDYYEGSDERCGVILGDATIMELDNVHPEPSQGFEISPEKILELLPSVVAFWHTHPNSTSTLSGADKLCIEQWPEMDHFIVGNDGVTKYQVIEGIVVDADHLSR